MRKVSRLVSAVVVAGATVPFVGVGTAYAETATEPASRGAYFYSAGVFNTGVEQIGAPRNVTGEATDGVAPEHLAVAVRTPGRADKVSFLAWDLESVPFDATITKAVATVPLAQGSATAPPNQNMVRNAAPNKVRACAAGDEGFNGEDGRNLDTEAPKVDCKLLNVTAKESADKKAYTFDITPLAATWLTGSNDGIALTPAEGALSSEFQVVFLPADKATIAVEYTLPPEVTEVVTEPVAPAAPIDTGGFSGTVDVPSIDTGVAEAPTVDTAVPQPQTMDSPAPQAPAVAAPITPVAVSESLSPTAGFWLGGLALAGLLALLSLIMGDPAVPAKAQRPSRLSQALQARQRGPRTAAARLRPISI